MKIFKKQLKSKKGQVLVEYFLLLALFIVIIGIFLTRFKPIQAQIAESFKSEAEKIVRDGSIEFKHPLLDRRVREGR